MSKQVVVLEKWDLKRAVVEAAGGRDPFKELSIPRVAITATIDMPEEDWEHFRHDPLMQAVVQEVFHDAIISYCRGRVIPTLHTLDERWTLARKDPQFHSFVKKSIEELFETELDHVYEKCREKVNEKMAQVDSQQKKYHVYKWKVLKQTALTAVAVGTAIAVTAGAAATGGATLGLAIYGLYRSTMDVINLIRNCAIEAETCHCNILNGLVTLYKQYGVGPGETASSARRVGNTTMEVAVNFLKSSVLKASWVKPIGSVKELKSELELWENKLSNLRYQAHDLSVELDKLLRKQDEKKKGIQFYEDLAVRAEKQQQPMPRSVEKDEIKHIKALAKAEKDVNQLLEKGFYIKTMAKWITIPELHQRAEKGTNAAEKIKPMVQELEREALYGRAATIISGCLDIAVSAGLLVANYTEASLNLGSDFLSSPEFFGITVPQDAYATMTQLYDAAVASGAPAIPGKPAEVFMTGGA